MTITDDPQAARSNSEELPVFTMDHAQDTHVTEVMDPVNANKVSCVTADPTVGVAKFSDWAVPTGTGGSSDDVIHASTEVPGPERTDGVPSVTQDEDVTSDVFDGVTNSLQ
jgi:hypothetical protein